MILERSKSEIKIIGQLFKKLIPIQAGIVLLIISLLTNQRSINSLEFSNLLAASSLIGLTYFSFISIRQKYLKLNDFSATSISSEKNNKLGSSKSNNHSEAVLEINPRTRQFVKANKQASHLFAYSLKELLKLELLEISPFSQPSGITSKNMAREKFNEALSGKEPIFEWTYENKYEEEIPCEVHLSQIASNGSKLLRANIIDLREEKQYAHEITRNNRMLLALQSLNKFALASSDASNEEKLIEMGGKMIIERLLIDSFSIFMRTGNQNWQKSYPEKYSILSQDLKNEESLVWRVAKAGKPIRKGEIKSNELDRKINSEVCVPIKIDSHVIGVISAKRNSVNQFSVEDEHMLIAFAKHLASGIRRLRHEASQIKKGKQQRILNELSSHLGGILDKSRLFNTLVKQLHEKMGFLGVSIYAINQKESLIQQVEKDSLWPPSANGKQYDQNISEGLLGKVVAKNEIVVSNNVQNNHDLIMRSQLEKVSSVALFPIRVHKNSRYILAIGSEQINYFGKDEIAPLKTLVDHLSVSLESISLFDATRRQLQELTVIHSISNTTAKAKSEPKLLEQATEVIGATLFPDKFGFVMLSENKTHLQIHPSYVGLDIQLIDQNLDIQEGIIGRVAISGIPLRVNHLDEGPGLRSISPNIQSILAVPLYSGQKVIGVINAESVDADFFSEGDLRLLSTIAGQIGSAIEKLRLYEAEKVQRGQAETLQEVAAILSGTADISKVADLILEELNRVVSFESASIQIIDEEDLVISAVAGKLSKNIVGYRLSINEDKFSHPMLEKHQTVFYEDISKHSGRLLAPGTENIKSWIGAPLIARGKCIGLLTVDGYKKNQFTHQDAQLVTSFAIHAAIAIENSRLFQEIEDSYSQTVSALANAIDVRDSYINGHSQRLANFATETARLLNCEKRTVEDIYWAALLHDIGKIGVPDEILNKPTKLNAKEFEVIKQHPAIGERIIEPIKKLAHLGPMIRGHQEKFDGTGYPDQLKGNEIPLASRIISVADAFVAMTDERIYRESISVEKALTEIKKSSGTQFDPEVVEAFLIVIRNDEIENGYGK